MFSLTFRLIIRQVFSIVFWTGKLRVIPACCTLLYFKYNSIGRIEVSCSSTLALVDLYALVMFCRHLFCMFLSGLTILSGIFPLAPALAHIRDPYVRAGLTTVLYSSFALWNVAHHVECVSVRN